MIRVKDKWFEPFIDQEAIEEMAARLGARISADYAGLEPLLVPILNGAYVFAADLIRHVAIPCEVTFVKVASYEAMETKGQVEEILGLDKDVKGRHVILVEDVVDTGITMTEVLRQVRELQPASVEIATLLYKPAALKRDLQLRYVGREIETVFVVGYGLDYDGWGRNLPDIWRWTGEEAVPALEQS